VLVTIIFKCPWMHFCVDDHSSHLNFLISRLTWIKCPGHDGVQGNEQNDQFAGGASVQGVLRLDKSYLLTAV
jgi:hypothetical protein